MNVMPIQYTSDVAAAVRPVSVVVPACYSSNTRWSSGSASLDWCGADDLERRAWTGLFDFRPTFELVARHLYHKLSERIAQLAYVELRDETFGVTTRYSPA